MRCVAFKPFARGSLVGFFDLEIGDGLTIRDCTLHEMNGLRWCGPPGKPMLTATKELVIQCGKPQYVAVIDFADRSARRRWSDAAVNAVDRYLKSKTPATGGRHVNPNRLGAANES